jgi:hypothetical protein
MIVVRYFAGLIVWGAIFATFACEIVLTGFFYNKS